jgi:arabinose-5-phosphate isomerase
MTTRRDALVAEGRRVLELEAAEVRGAAARLDDAFARAVELLAARTGRVIVSGVGKSGLIARKLAATLTSTGTPAMYLHPVDSLHGDLGIVGRDDVAIVLSKSGDSDDLMGLLASLQRLAVPIIAITGGTDSMLARAATVVLDAGVSEEACPHDLAPTSSTTVALLGVNGFRREDFAALHPGGSLGRKLLLRVRDVMLPPDGTVAPATPMREVVVTLAHHRGIALVTEGRRLAGVFTAGDLTRLAQQDGEYLGHAVCDHMTRTPKSCAPDDAGAAAVGLMERYGIMVLPVLDAGEVVGVVHLHDLLRAGAV